MKAYQVMFFNAIVLIALGIYGFSIPPHSPTALISTAIGLILSILAFFVKKENHIIAHIAIAITGLSFLLFIVVGLLRHNSMIILMAIVTLLSLVFYISDFIKRKNEAKSKT